MFSSPARAFGLLALYTSVTTATFRYDEKIAKDIVIVGGGASGAYAAFRLREDYGKSIALIEKQGALVGSPFTCAEYGLMLPVIFPVPVSKCHLSSVG